MPHNLKPLTLSAPYVLSLILAACGTTGVSPVTLHTDLALTGTDSDLGTSVLSPSAEAGSRASSSSEKAGTAPKIGRRVVKTADLVVISSEPQDGLHKAVRMAKQLGGYTLDAHRSKRSLGVTLRVPARHFEQALRRLSKLGHVDRRSIRGTDVTTEYVDLSMRLKNALQVRQRYLELIRRADNVEQTLAVQKELERVTATIESLKGRLGVLESQVSMSTIRLTLKTPTEPGPVGWVFYGLYKGIVWLFVWS